MSWRAAAKTQACMSLKFDLAHNTVFRTQHNIPKICRAGCCTRAQPYAAVRLTGLPCAPILGWGSSTRTPLGVSAAMLRVTSATSRHTWWMPPARRSVAATSAAHCTALQTLSPTQRTDAAANVSLHTYAATAVVRLPCFKTVLKRQIVPSRHSTSCGDVLSMRQPCSMHTINKHTLCLPQPTLAQPHLQHINPCAPHAVLSR